MPLRDVKEYLVGKVEVSELMSDDKLVNDLDVYQSKFKVRLRSALYPSPPSLESIKQLPILALVDHDTQDKVAKEIKFAVDSKHILGRAIKLV